MNFYSKCTRALTFENLCQEWTMEELDMAYPDPVGNVRLGLADPDSLEPHGRPRAKWERSSHLVEMRAPGAVEGLIPDGADFSIVHCTMALHSQYFRALTFQNLSQSCSTTGSNGQTLRSWSWAAWGICTASQCRPASAWARSKRWCGSRSACTAMRGRTQRRASKSTHSQKSALHWL